MHADKTRLELDDLTSKIIGCAYQVSNTLGSGFVEKVYENALCHELSLVGLSINQQQGLQVFYKNILVGEYIADIIVNDLIILELKADKALDNSSSTMHELS